MEICEVPEPVDPNDHLALEVIPPARIAQLVEEVGVKKCALPLQKLFVLAVLAGAFIAFGGVLYTLVVTDSALGFGVTRLVGGLAFSLGLILVVIGGAELFTGNSLIVMAWADRRVTLPAMLRNWGCVYVGNLVGSLLMVALVHYAGVLDLGGGSVARTAITIAEGKLSLGSGEAILRGVLCNVLVCLAIWMCFAARTAAGKVPLLMLPVAAFVALGFEHSVANMYLIPIAMLQPSMEMTVLDFLQNLIPVTFGNMIGGGGLVAAVYWLVYLRGSGQ